MPRFPEWIIDEARKNKAALRQKPSLNTIADLSAHRLRTVCDEALCPNKGGCFAEGEATFLILGAACTRTCRFCAVSKAAPLPPDPGEPERVGELSKKWGLKYAVFTSPTRDDLPDGGAGHFARTAAAVKKADARVKVELLIPDFNGEIKALETVLDSNPDVLGHNIETVPGLYAKVRAGADYKRSLNLIKASKRLRPDIFTKSGLMLGLGETEKEIDAVLNDLRDHNCELLTLGQYLAPSNAHLPVVRYLPPDEFARRGEKAEKMGFKAVLAGPLVRSSYRAGRLYQAAREVDRTAAQVHGSPVQRFNG
ncbi:MAG: lipoyl synthase [Elusimicrobia bacterium]|nr:lipoyl synthase [Elusimicrobiota bacterium]